MEVKNFLFEIGTEEIPATYINQACQTLHTIFKAQLKKHKLKYKNIELFNSPRRMAIRITDLQTKQNDINTVRRGPAKRIAFDENDNLTKAGSGFLRGAGANEEDIFFEDTPKGEYIAVKIFKSGEKTETILIKLMQEILEKISYPKSMRWGDNNFAFARPIRWLIAIFGKEIIPFDFLDLQTDRKTYGNRYLGLQTSAEIEDVMSYENVLDKIKVIAHRGNRKQFLFSALKELTNKNNLHLVEDNKLMELNVDITEFPHPILANFSEKYLTLPDEIIVLALAEHQKCFSVKDKEGNLSNQFICISNGNPEFDDLIRKGNEKVVNARLADAQFFYREDTKIDFAEFVYRLADVTFQEKLGSLYEKTERIEKLSEFIADEISLTEDLKKYIHRTAHLCKADLPTTMLGEKEFTKLQGYIGKMYALKSGEDEMVANAIEQHYRPKGKNDLIPDDVVGSVVAIADKIDTICGICGIGMLPTGSTDPFALRRAANGIVQIVAGRNFEIDLFKLVDFAYELINEKLEEKNANKNFVYDYLTQRMEWYLKQQKIDYDIIESVICSDLSSLPQLIRKAKDIQSFKSDDNFKKLVLGFKRVSNILDKQKEFAEIEENLFAEDAERDLFIVIEKNRPEIQLLLEKHDFKSVMRKLVELRGNIDNLFDNVMINSEDKKLRANRYNLLNSVRKMFLKIADISKIVVEGD